MCRPYWRGLGNDERVEGVARSLLPLARRGPSALSRNCPLGWRPLTGPLQLLAEAQVCQEHRLAELILLKGVMEQSRRAADEKFGFNCKE